jgi:hypothetical protein
MNDIEKSRLEDFKRVLTYRIVTKIVHDFKGKYELYYDAPRYWAAWRNQKLPYNKKIYELIIKFNSTALSTEQCKHIFGKGVSYSNLIAGDPSIKTFNKGTICMGGRRFGIK